MSVEKTEEFREKVDGFTIDGATSNDLDDAIHLERDGAGWVVHVSIADAASSIPKDSPLDLQARRSGATRYRMSGNKPMLPRQLSEGALSLLPGQKRSVMTISMPLSKSLDMGPADINLMALVSRAKLSYQQVDEILRNGRHELADMLSQCSTIAQALLDKRRARGAFLVYDLFSGWATTEEGAIRRLKPEERHLGNIIIQQFMILANEAVARFLLALQAPALFRNHTAKPAAPTRSSLIQDYEMLGSQPDAARVATLQDRVSLVMNKATYGPRLEGHYGLNLPAYLHGTSPIRRYADLVTQRIICASLSGENPPYTLRELEQIGAELTAIEWERKRRREAFMQEKRHDRTRTQILKDEVAHLEGSQFHQVVKMAARENRMTPELADEISSRAASDRIEPRDACYLLLGTIEAGEAWIRAKRQTLLWIVQHPHHALSVLTMAHQNGLCANADYSTSPVPDALEHRRLFTATGTITVNDQPYTSDALIGTSKKDAQQAAAVDLLIRIVCGHTGLSRTDFAGPQQPPAGPDAIGDGSDTNHKGRLLELCSQRRWPAPSFRITQEGASHRPTITVVAELRVSGSDYRTQPVACGNKKQAEQLAAKELLDQLRVLLPKPTNVESSNPEPTNRNDTDSPAATVGNFVAVLQEWCVQNGRPYPDYRFSVEGQRHSPTVTCICTVENKQQGLVSEVGTGTNKKAAKQAAAEAAHYAVTRSDVSQN
jgi:ribonuclease R